MRLRWRFVIRCEDAPRNDISRILSEAQFDLTPARTSKWVCSEGRTLG